jgi:hypothetical protein
MGDEDKRVRAAGCVALIGGAILAAVWFGWLPIAKSAPCEVQARVQPSLPPACEVGDLSAGSVFADPMGALYMVVTPARPAEYFSGDANPVLHGVRNQPAQTGVVVPYFIAGYGHFTLTHPGPVYVVALRDGSLALMKRDTWARPARARMAVTLGEVDP